MALFYSLQRMTRKISIEVGYGLEGAVTDVTSKSIIDNDLTPNFKEGNYYRGLDEGLMLSSLQQQVSIKLRRVMVAKKAKALVLVLLFSLLSY